MRLLGAALGLAVGAVASIALGLARPADRTRSSPAATPDSGGRIASVLIHYTPSAAEATVPAYRDLLAALGPETEVVVAVEDRADLADLRRRLGRQAEVDRLTALEVGRSITTWSRDRFLTAEASGRPLLVVPRQRSSPLPTRANDWVVPWVAGSAQPERLAVTQSDLAFDGGDLVVDEERAYATAVLLERGRDVGLTLDQARAAVSRLTGREPIILGSRPEEVPAHHIGMFVTPIGGGTVLVGSPRLGAALLEEAGAPDLAERLEVDLSSGRHERFDRVAQDLRGAGVRVVPLPLLPTRSELVYVTWNNVLVDDRPDGRHVLLPSYGVPALDRAGQRAWEALGFVVHPIDVSRLYRHGGAVRCLVAVIERRVP